MQPITTIEPKIDMPLNLSWHLIKRAAVLAYMCDCSFNQVVEAALFQSVYNPITKQDIK